MKQAFRASLCHIGAHGGGLYLDEKAVTFKCQKLTIEDKFRMLEIPYDSISEIIKCRSLLLFPAVIIRLKNGEQHKFIVFSRKKFLDLSAEFIK